MGIWSDLLKYSSREMSAKVSSTGRSASSYWSSKKEGSYGPGGRMLYETVGEVRSEKGSQAADGNEEKLTLNVYRSLVRVIAISLEHKEGRAPWAYR